MENVKSIFLDNDINLIGYEIKGNKIIVRVINKNKNEISKITFIVINAKYECNINSSSEIIETEFEIDDSHFVSVPKIFSYVVNGVLKEFNTTNKHYVKEAKLLNDVTKRNRKQILNLIYEETGQKLEKVYYPFEDDNYWSCYCGKINFTNKCENCHCDKEYSKNLLNKIEEKKERVMNFDSTESNFFTWQMIVFIFHILFVNILFNGDILYENQDLISFFSVFNRFIIPIIICICSLILSLFINRMNKKVEIGVRAFRLISLLYLNVIMFVSFANVSYNFFLTTSFDLIFLLFGIKKLSMKKEKTKYSVFSAFFAGSIIFSLSSLIFLKQHNFRVGVNSIYIEPNDVEIYTVPDKVNGLNVSKVEFKNDFDAYKKLKKIYISKDVSSISISSPKITPNLESIELDKNNKYFVIEDGVLYYKDSMKAALIPSAQEEVTISAERIYQKCFANWEKLKKITFASSVKKIDDFAFEGCYKLTDVTFMDDSKLMSIGKYSFSSCVLLSKIVIPSSCKQIGFGAFAFCSSLRDLTLPFIGKERYTLYDTSNKNTLDYIFALNYNSILIENLVITNQAIVQNSSFYKCPVKNVIINPFVGYIGDLCFAYSKIESIVIPEGVDRLGRESFRGCNKLHTVIFPSTLKKIEANAFLEDVNLQNVDFSKVNLENLVIEQGNELLDKFIGK